MEASAVRSHRVYKPAGKNEWRAVYRTASSGTKKSHRKMISYSITKFGNEGAKIRANAVCRYINHFKEVPSQARDIPLHIEPCCSTCYPVCSPNHGCLPLCNNPSSSDTHVIENDTEAVKTVCDESVCDRQNPTGIVVKREDRDDDRKSGDIMDRKDSSGQRSDADYMIICAMERHKIINKLQGMEVEGVADDAIERRDDINREGCSSSTEGSNDFSSNNSVRDTYSSSGNGRCLSYDDTSSDTTCVSAYGSFVLSLPISSPLLSPPPSDKPYSGISSPTTPCLLPSSTSRGDCLLQSSRQIAQSSPIVKLAVGHLKELQRSGKDRQDAARHLYYDMVYWIRLYERARHEIKQVADEIGKIDKRRTAKIDSLDNSTIMNIETTSCSTCSCPHAQHNITNTQTAIDNLTSSSSSACSCSSLSCGHDHPSSSYPTRMSPCVVSHVACQDKNIRGQEYEGYTQDGNGVRIGEMVDRSDKVSSPLFMYGNREYGLFVSKNGVQPVDDEPSHDCKGMESNAVEERPVVEASLCQSIRDHYTKNVEFGMFPIVSKSPIGKQMIDVMRQPQIIDSSGAVLDKKDFMVRSWYDENGLEEFMIREDDGDIAGPLEYVEMHKSEAASTMHEFSGNVGGVMGRGMYTRLRKKKDVEEQLQKTSPGGRRPRRHEGHMEASRQRKSIMAEVSRGCVVESNSGGPPHSKESVSVWGDSRLVVNVKEEGVIQDREDTRQRECAAIEKISQEVEGDGGVDHNMTEGKEKTNTVEMSKDQRQMGSKKSIGKCVRRTKRTKDTTDGNMVRAMAPMPPPPILTGSDVANKENITPHRTQQETQQQQSEHCTIREMRTKRGIHRKTDKQGEAGNEYTQVGVDSRYADLNAVKVKTEELATRQEEETDTTHDRYSRGEERWHRVSKQPNSYAVIRGRGRLTTEGKSIRQRMPKKGGVRTRSQRAVALMESFSTLSLDTNRHEYPNTCGTQDGIASCDNTKTSSEKGGETSHSADISMEERIVHGEEITKESSVATCRESSIRQDKEVVSAVSEDLPILYRAHDNNSGLSNSNRIVKSQHEYIGSASPSTNSTVEYHTSPISLISQHDDAAIQSSPQHIDALSTSSTNLSASTDLDKLVQGDHKIAEWRRPTETHGYTEDGHDMSLTGLEQKEAYEIGDNNNMRLKNTEMTCGETLHGRIYPTRKRSRWNEEDTGQYETADALQTRANSQQATVGTEGIRQDEGRHMREKEKSCRMLGWHEKQQEEICCLKERLSQQDDEVSYVGYWNENSSLHLESASKRRRNRFHDKPTDRISQWEEPRREICDPPNKCEKNLRHQRCSVGGMDIANPSVQDMTLSVPYKQDPCVMKGHYLQMRPHELNIGCGKRTEETNGQHAQGYQNCNYGHNRPRQTNSLSCTEEMYRRRQQACGTDTTRRSVGYVHPVREFRDQHHVPVVPACRSPPHIWPHQEKLIYENHLSTHPYAPPFTQHSAMSFYHSAPQQPFRPPPPPPPGPPPSSVCLRQHTLYPPPPSCPYPVAADSRQMSRTPQCLQSLHVR
eukprot:GHVQ01038806.1.p1 GENE.GHVQ01038806.1~~GHVQ01038806.1.p1  ORF type:complete len:1535 (+),score=331.19 GHVQ01038806.1:124-4728(+)